jgi:hypothetical protein
MSKIGPTLGAQAILRNFELGEKRLIFATALTLTRVAQRVREAEYRAMQSSFDRPKPYTLNSLFLQKATPERLVARVWLKDDLASSNAGTPATDYLRPHIEGGTRGQKYFERALQTVGAMPQGTYAVPGRGAELDAWGNPSRSLILRILSQLRVQIVAGYDRSLPVGTDRKTQSKRRRAFGRAGGQFVALPKGLGKLPPGIYLAEGRDFGAKLGFGRTGRLKAVFLFKRGVAYRVRYDFWGTARTAIAANLRTEARRAGAEVLRASTGMPG